MKEYPVKAAGRKNDYRATELIVLTDVHYCHINWYGMTSEERLEKMISDVNRYYNDHPYDAALFLGDYSLDHWAWSIRGSWLNQGVSNTFNFIRKYASRMTCPDYYFLPGNHEQYGGELWRAITGFERQYYVRLGGYLVFMLDTFAGDLDPDHDTDGVYTPVPAEAIRAVMAKYPDSPVLLCAHYFDLGKETEDFRSLVRDERVIALFCGHDHVRTIEKLGEEYGGKTVFHCGTFSYTAPGYDFAEHPWGWRTVSLKKDGITVRYYTPKSAAVVDEKPIETEDGFIDETFVSNPLAK